MPELDPYVLKYMFMEWEDEGYPLSDTNTEDLAHFYGITSEAYYFYDMSLIADGIYDLMCKELLSRTDLPEWIDKESLEAGTGYDNIKFPKAVKITATDLLF